MHALLVKLIPYIQCGISRIVHYVEFLHQAKSTYSGDWIEGFSFAEDFPIHPVLDVIVLQEPDVIAQTSARFTPVLDAGVVSIQPPLECCVSEASVGLHLVGVQSFDNSDIN